MNKPRFKLIEALAYCVEALACQSLMDGNGAINTALQADCRVWDHLDDRTLEVLDRGLGLTPPPVDPTNEKGE